MKNLLIIWVIFQLIIIGVASVSIHNKVFFKTYECGATQEVPLYIGILMPLNAFTANPQVAIDYCVNKQNGGN